MISALTQSLMFLNLLMVEKKISVKLNELNALMVKNDKERGYAVGL